MDSQIGTEVKAFIVQNFMFGQATELAADQSFLQTGVVDSTGLLELVSFLEERYGISVEDRDLTPENLDSLANVSRYVSGKIAATAR